MLTVFWAVGATLSLGAAASRAAEVFDLEMTVYRQTIDSSEIAALKQRLERGEVQLEKDARHGYLPGLLRELGVPASSQMLVASKTSPNRALISPKNPRALYFNERVAVAYVPGAPLIEIAAQDAKLGAVFYTLNQQSGGPARLTRDDRCVECHASAKTLDVPGLLVRSFRTDVDGEVDLLSGIFVNQRTPLNERWGGYYVTGTHGPQPHLGNLFGPEARARLTQQPGCNGNITNLSAFLDTSKYPEAGSDIVALLVFDHQVYLENLLTRLGFETTAALRRGDDLRPIYPAADAVLRYILFVGEAPLAAPIKGTSGFAPWFEQQGRKDKLGRSLRQFDLQTRLFKWPCSCMIDSAAFRALPVAAKKHLWHRLWQVLNNEDASPEFARIPPEAKRAVLEILAETEPDLPAYWKL